MHLLYKVVRATSAAHLATQFAVALVEGRPKDSTFKSEELMCVEETKGEVEKGNKLVLRYACFNGFVAETVLYKFVKTRLKTVSY